MTKLPKVFVITDVPVEHTVHGSALLYRLFENNLGFELFIAEGSIQLPLNSSAKLINAEYYSIYTGSRRLLNTRFSKFFRSLFFLFPFASIVQLFILYCKLKPEVVITVSHGIAWYSAYFLCRLTKLPLILICHDDILQFHGCHRFLASLVYRRFKSLYTYSYQSFLICDSMKKGYEKKFGKNGITLYPTRSLTALVKTPDQVMARRKPFNYNIGFAGSIASPEYAQMLGHVANLLKLLGGSLFIYGPHTRGSLSKLGIVNPNIVVKGLLESNDLISDMHCNLDALYVPITFNIHQANSATYAFPSKLADYTCTSLPIIIQAPAYASAASWALLYRSAILVDTLDTNVLSLAFRSLSSIDTYNSYCISSYQAGMTTFQHQVQVKILYKTLQAVTMSSG